jgi:hypothetical protein
MVKLRILLGALCLYTSMFAQTFTSSITGIITDPTGAVIPRAEVTLTDTKTNATRNVSTNELGRYTFSQLLASNYSLRVKATGFGELIRSGIELTASTHAEVDLTLGLRGLAETVEVTAAAPLLNTQSASSSSALDSQILNQLPQPGRNVMGLAVFTAGISYAQGFMAGVASDQNTARFNIGGVRQNSTPVLIDGIPSLSMDWGGLIAQPAVEDVQEVQVSKSAYEAQYGRTGGGVVSMTTKAGTQQYHGTLFEYFRNNRLNANSFWNNLNNAPLAKTTRNQYGGNFAGPIWRAKRITGLFGYEGFKNPSSSSVTRTVPTDLQRQGDFSQTFNGNETLQVIYDPSTTRPNPSRPGEFIRDPFPGNRVPVNSFDPIAVKYLAGIPPATGPGHSTTHANNYFSSGVYRTSSTRYDARLDWAVTDKLSFFGRATKARNVDKGPIFIQGFGNTTQYQINPRFVLGAGATYIVSPTMVATLLVGAGHWDENYPNVNYGFDFKSLGFPASVASMIQAPVPPSVSLGSSYSGYGDNWFRHSIRNNYTVQLSVSKELVSHSIKFGWSLELQQGNFHDVHSASFNFHNNGTAGPDPYNRTGLTGNGFASMLIGFGESGAVPMTLDPAGEDAYHALYVQDSWKATRKLTVSYGIRWEVQPARTERFNRLSYLDLDSVNPIGQEAGLPNLKGGLAFASPSHRSPWSAPLNNWAPRVGLAYSLTKNLVVRAGYGIFYQKTSVDDAGASSNGFSADTPWVTSLDGGLTPFNLWSSAFSQGISAPPGSALGLKTLVGSDIRGFTQVRPTPYVQQYSFDLQYALGDTMVVEAGYSGIQGRKMTWPGPFSLNQLPDSALALGTALQQSVPNPFQGIIKSGPLSGPTVLYGQLLRPYPQFNSVGALMVGASSSFNAFSTKLTRRLSNGLTAIASYQFSKSIDNASESTTWIGDVPLRNFNDASLDRSIGSHDIPHSFALAFSYAVPIGRGLRFGSHINRLLDAVVGGWSTSGIYKLESGQPMHFGYADNTNSYNQGIQEPNISDRSKLKLSNPTRLAWFNTSVFTDPAKFTYGNAPRYVGEVRGSRNNNLDLGVHKSFSPMEKLRLQLRAELFNAFNRNRFSNPNGTLGSNSFGQITGSFNRPREVEVGLRLSF